MLILNVFVCLCGVFFKFRVCDKKTDTSLKYSIGKITLWSLVSDLKALVFGF